MVFVLNVGVIPCNGLRVGILFPVRLRVVEPTVRIVTYVQNAKVQVQGSSMAIVALMRKKVFQAVGCLGTVVSTTVSTVVSTGWFDKRSVLYLNSTNTIAEER